MAARSRVSGLGPSSRSCHSSRCGREAETQHRARQASRAERSQARYTVSRPPATRSRVPSMTWSRASTGTSRCPRRTAAPWTAAHASTSDALPRSAHQPGGRHVIKGRSEERVGGRVIGDEALWLARVERDLEEAGLVEREVDVRTAAGPEPSRGGHGRIVPLDRPRRPSRRSSVAPSPGAPRMRPSPEARRGPGSGGTRRSAKRRPVEPPRAGPGRRRRRVPRVRWPPPAERGGGRHGGRREPVHGGSSSVHVDIVHITP